MALFVTVLAVILPAFAEAPLHFARIERAVIHEKPRAEIIFAGDMMFDRTVRRAMEEKGPDHIFSCIKDTLLSADLVVANLEGPITPYESMSLGSAIGSPENFTFTFPTSTASLLARHNIRVVNLGNNHIKNFGDAGVRETKAFLNAAQVVYFGDPSQSGSIAREDVGDVLFSFVSWSDWTGASREETVAHVRAEREAGRLPIVYTHWGEEYVEAREREKILAREFIDAGAEMVIGSHPHVVQEREFYRGKTIYYSLGNFMFDQYWNEAVRTGLLVRVTFDDRGVAGIDEIPVTLERDRRTCLKGE